MTDIESMLPSSEQIRHWEDEYFDEGQNFDVLLVEAYQAGYQACEAKYEAAMAEIVNPMDLGIEFQDDDERNSFLHPPSVSWKQLRLWALKTRS